MLWAIEIRQTVNAMYYIRIRINVLKQRNHFIILKWICINVGILSYGNELRISNHIYHSTAQKQKLNCTLNRPTYH